MQVWRDEEQAAPMVERRNAGMQPFKGQFHCDAAVGVPRYGIAWNEPISHASAMNEATCIVRVVLILKCGSQFEVVAKEGECSGKGVLGVPRFQRVGIVRVVNEQ